MEFKLYKKGGINITGLRLVDFDSKEVKNFLNNGWETLAQKAARRPRPQTSRR